VGNSNRQGTIGNANCLDPDEGARSLDATIKLIDSLTRIAQKIFTRYMHVVEINFGEGDGVETHRWQLARCPRRARTFDQKAVDERLAVSLFAGSHHERHEVCIPAEFDPFLFSGNAKAVMSDRRGTTQVTQIRASLRLGDGGSRNPITGEEPRQKREFLLCGAAVI